ncbi:MAG: hypothetical protein IKF78_05360 [Atopobiaceae bacterium]|nr:hypothetical protein [Atopobiaceae bacterium]
MTGKVFPNSADIYQDQAQVLFDYYRQAAEKVVSEEMALEQQISEVGQERIQAASKSGEAKKKLVIVFVAGGAAALILLLLTVFVSPFAIIFLIGALATAGILAFRLYNTQKAEETNSIEFSKRLAALQAQHQSIRRDYRVQSVGVAYVPVARHVKAGNRSYVVDFTGDVPETEFSLTLINQPGELKEAMDSLQGQMETMPAVESNEEVEQVDTSDYSTSVQDVTLHDYMGSIDRQVRSVRYLIGDSRDVSVSVPVVHPGSERYRMLSEYATNDTANYPIVPVFDASQAEAKTKEFSSLGALNQRSASDGSGDIAFFVKVMRQLAQGVDMLSRSRTESMSKITNYYAHVMQNVLKASFDQYSPTLEAEEIERIRTATFNYGDEINDYKPFSLKQSSRVRLDLFSGTWIADNGSRTAMPFGMHQVDTEVLMPVIQNLMQENRVERLRIYSDIQNQKTDYLNQWHRDTEDFFGRNRAEANALIQRMNEAYAEYVESYTNYQQQSATIASMKASGNLEDAEVQEAKNEAEVIAGFQLQADQARAKQAEFMEFMERIREDIDRCAEQFGHVEYYEASLRDYQAREVARAVSNVRELEPRRRRLVSISPYLAQEGDVPPEPVTSQKLDEDFAINLEAQAEGHIRTLASGNFGA